MGAQISSCLECAALRRLVFRSSQRLPQHAVRHAAVPRRCSNPDHYHRDGLPDPRPGCDDCRRFCDEMDNAADDVTQIGSRIRHVPRPHPARTELQRRDPLPQNVRDVEVSQRQASTQNEGDVDVAEPRPAFPADLIIGEPPHVSVQVKLMSPFLEETVTVMCSKVLLVSALLEELCRGFHIEVSECSLLHDGKELPRQESLVDACSHMPSAASRQRGGAVEVTLFRTSEVALARECVVRHPVQHLPSPPRRDERTDVQRDERMCPKCYAGPVINEACWDLQAHNSRGWFRKGRNECPQCNFFSASWGEWAVWDNGVLREALLSSAAASIEER